MAKAKRPKMTAAEATRFERFSPANAAILEGIASERGCGCVPYTDWLTFKRWRALGRHVIKGAGFGVSLTTYLISEREAPDGTKTQRRRPWRYTVFCRCRTAANDDATPSA